MREETENAFQDPHSLQIPELNIEVQKSVTYYTLINLGLHIKQNQDSKDWLRILSGAHQQYRKVLLQENRDRSVSHHSSP